MSGIDVSSEEMRAYLETLTPQEKADLQQAFADVRQAVKENRVSPDRLQPIQWKMMEVARKGNSLTRQDMAIRVVTADRRAYDARLVGTAPDYDLAVVQMINPPPKDQLRPITLATSADLKVGQKVFAIGNPFGLSLTLTTGIISNDWWDRVQRKPVYCVDDPRWAVVGAAELEGAGVAVVGGELEGAAVADLD